MDLGQLWLIEVRGLANRSEGLANRSEGLAWLGPVDKSKGLWGRAGLGLVDKSEELRPGLAWALSIKVRGWASGCLGPSR